VFVQLNYDGEKALVIWKAHHSLCDGISGMGLTLQCDDTFDPDKLMKTGKINFWWRMLFRLMAPLLVPALFIDAFATKVLRNPMPDGVRKLTGVKKCAISDHFETAEIKATSKALKVTINDLMTSSLSVAVSRYFKEKDPASNHTRLNVALPANIRWSRYERFEDVKLENKFAPYPLTIPLSENIEEALPAVSKVTATLRSGFAKVYASYIINFISGLILPRFVCKKMVDIVTLPPTLAFSNVPGPLKRISYKGNETLSSYMAIVIAGRCGLAIGILSYCEKLSFSVVSDTAVMRDPCRLKELLEEAIKEYIELGKTKAD
jgi:NRPS condensation-like uncharacterized protein